MKKILLTGIRFYQRYLSPIKGGSTCKFYPTCSQYAKEIRRVKRGTAGSVENSAL